MESSQISFRSILDIEGLREFQELSDGELYTEDGYSFKIHKIVLAKKSEYFYRLFCGIGKRKKNISLPGVRGHVLGNILSYLYTGEVYITEDNVCELLTAADYLLLDDLISRVKGKYIKENLSVRNCLPLYITAFKLNRKDILKDVFRFVETHFEVVASFEHSELGDLPFDALKGFLGSKNLCIRDDAAMWSVIVQWVQKDASHRLFYVPDLLMYLTVSNMDEQLATTIFEHSVIASNPSCEEIKRLKMSDSTASNCQILSNYIQYRLEPILISKEDKSSERFYFIAHYCVHNQRDGVYIYVTYDENIDLWRKIIEIDVYPEFMLSVGHSIYLFHTTEDKNFRFDLVERKWHAVVDFRSRRNFYGVAVLNDQIYVLGGMLFHSGTETNMVEAYDPVSEVWLDVQPMIPVTCFNTEVFDKRIFVIGNIFTDLEMTAQAYDPVLGVWTVIPAPSLFRYNFGLVAYHGKLYVIGGRNESEYFRSVETFEPKQQKWTRHKNLPFIYYFPKAFVLKDKLIVYDSHLEDRDYLKTNPAVQWDENLGSWELFDDSSPMNTLHKYCFFTPRGEKCIQRILKENKDPRTHFTKSPFH